MAIKEINKVKLREADTREEKLLLGFLHEETNRVSFGSIVVEFIVRDGRVQRMVSTEVRRTFNVDNN